MRLAHDENRQRPDVKERKNAARRVVNNPERTAINLRSTLRRYGVTPEQFEVMVADQNGRCAICGAIPDGRQSAGRLHVDHDHETGANRGLLCVRCNPGIGHFLDDPELLRAAADYIDRHRPK